MYYGLRENKENRIDINPYYDIVTFVGTFHILSDTYITYLLIIIYDKDIESYIIYKKKKR
jgi:hypothetical protein